MAIANDVVAGHAVSLAAAVILAVAAMAPQSEIKPAMRLLAQFSLAILFPIFWMILQIIPLPFSSLANPIWSTASSALNEPSMPVRISLDPGATFRSLFLYLTILSLTVAMVIVGRDRRNAETIFLVLATVTTFMSLEMLLSRLESFAGMMPASSVNFIAIAALGTLINFAVVIMAIERHLTRRNSEASYRASLLFGLALGLIGLAVCLSAMKVFAPGNVFAATAVGFSAIIFVAVARRIELGAWISVLLFAAFSGVAATLIVPRFEYGPSAGIARFATSATAESLAMAKRAGSDLPWLGNGVGTFKSLTQIYRDFGSALVPEPPSTAVAVATEWGQPALVVLAGLTILLIVALLLGAVRRGRDSFFPSAAAAGVLVILGEAFCDSSLLNPTVQIIVAILIGLGVSQSVGRTPWSDDQITHSGHRS
ncbi:O-antigen ligase [Bradyrhizobium sp. JYMT SZCCT0428]|uniref:O-antigen ligase family protein n=1 Tax=Bradyrhizobium sp. JYMT SZCCT0428 TaxID=2807673 RepID=UPI001BAAFBDB|nr:hypothetical protein [Bradyrhizobium sp. JYMT SZCCT0428]MBR1151601.1 hypothetical protein [Bradyrhizobium sp. JYMT SZCCT0428]